MILDYRDYNYMISLHILYGVNFVIGQEYVFKKIAFRLPGKNSWPQNKLQNKRKYHCLHIKIKRNILFYYFLKQFL